MCEKCLELGNEIVINNVVYVRKYPLPQVKKQESAKPEEPFTFPIKDECFMVTQKSGGALHSDSVFKCTFSDKVSVEGTMVNTRETSYSNPHPGGGTFIFKRDIWAFSVAK